MTWARSRNKIAGQSTQLCSKRLLPQESTLVVLQVLICGQRQLHLSDDGADAVAAEQSESRIFHSGVGYIMRQRTKANLRLGVNTSGICQEFKHLLSPPPNSIAMVLARTIARKPVLSRAEALYSPIASVRSLLSQFSLKLLVGTSRSRGA